MIKVFQIIPTLGVGGAEKLVLDLSQRLNKDKFEVYIISLYDKDKFEFNYNNIENIKFISLSKKSGFDISVIVRLHKLFKENKPDIVHTHTYVVPYVLIPCILDKVKCRIHTIHSIAGYELNNIIKIVMFFGYHMFNIVPVGISPTVVESIKKVYKIKNVELVHNCIDTEKFKASTVKHSNKTFKLVTVARISEVKNHELMIDSFIKAYNVNNKLRLNIIGDGPLKTKLKNKVEKLKMDNYIRFCGVSDNVPEELSKSDAFILSSKFEGLPLSILEAMSCGLPIISTDVGGVKDIVINEYNGYLTEQNVNSISSAIIDISTNSNKYVKYSNNSQKLSKKYNIYNMVKGYEELYEKLYNNKRKKN